MSEAIGWISSVLLSVTIAIQIHKQWKEKSSRGVSMWLFSGQVAAELGFVIYSYMLGNWVFVFTNTVLLIENFVGLWVTLKFKKSSS